MAPNGSPLKRPRLAAVVTSYKKYLHPQHVVDRFLDGYGWSGTYHHSEMDVVSLYVDQRGEGDPLSGQSGSASGDEDLFLN